MLSFLELLTTLQKTKINPPKVTDRSYIKNNSEALQVLRQCQ